MHTRILLHRADQFPIRFAGVHLTARTSVDGQRLRPAVLDTFGQIDDDAVFVIPSQPRFYRHRYAITDAIHHRPNDVEHQIRRLQHACAGSFARDLFHRTTEVQVQHIRMCRFDDNFCRLGHSARIASVNLDCHGAFVVTNREFLERFVDHSHQSIGGHKFRVDHRRAEPSTQEAEADVGYILHGSEHHGAGAQIDIAYFHELLRCFEKSEPRIISPANPATSSSSPSKTCTTAGQLSPQAPTVGQSIPTTASALLAACAG